MSGVELLASYFTLAGDVYPFGPTEISPFAFRHRVEAAAEAGYKGIGLIYDDLLANSAELGWDEMRRILIGNGIKYTEFEFLVDWYAEGDARVASDKMRRDLLQAAEALGTRSIKVAPGLHQDIADVQRMAEAFHGVCQDAADHGTNIVLEIMPFSNVRTLETGLAIVEKADQPNGGLLIDIWHMVRGGIDVRAISSVPAKFIGAIELDDADKYPLRSLWDDTIYRRRLPAEGSFDIPGFIEAVQRTGYTGPWGVEILSETFRKLPLLEMAHRSFQATMRQFQSLNGDDLMRAEGRSDGHAFGRAAAPTIS